jgi:hypothetical protein
MEPNTKGLLPYSFKPLQNKAFIVFNALFDNNVSGSTIGSAEKLSYCESRCHTDLKMMALEVISPIQP